MFDKKTPYTLRVENESGTTHYYLRFIDGQANKQEIEVTEEIYQVFREFEKQNKREQHFFDRHVEHSTVTEEAFQERAIHVPKGIE